MNNEQIVCILSGFIKNGSVITTGVASPLPLFAIRLAQLSKDFTYLNCTGAIDPVISRSTYSSVTVHALEKKNSELKLEAIWEYANRNLIDLMFFGASQADSRGNINLTCIGDYKGPKVKLPGPAASVSLRRKVKQSILVIPKHSKKVFVEKVDFITSPAVKNTLAVTDLCLFELGGNPKILSIHPGHTLDEVKENTGFQFEIPSKISQTPMPTQEELCLIKKLDTDNLLDKV